MLRDKRFIAVLVVLLLGMLVYDIQYFSNRHKASSARNTPAAAPIAATQFTLPTRTSATKEASHSTPSGTFAHLRTGSRNPFLTASEQYGGKFPGQFSDKGEGDVHWPTLSGISWNDGHWTALLDGEAVTPGDRIGDIRVIEITISQVTLTWGSQRLTLELPSASAPSTAEDQA